jgi:hypothetical protein
MSQSVLQPKRVLRSDAVKASQEMEVQLQALAASEGSVVDINDVKVVTYESGLDVVAPETAVRWSKTTCC